MKTLFATLLLFQSPHHAVEILSFTAKPTSIHAGGSAILEWKTRGVDTVSIDSEPNAPRKAALPASGTLQVQPAVTTKYTLTCEADGNYCASLSVTVTVN